MKRIKVLSIAASLRIGGTRKAVADTLYQTGELHG